MNRVLLFFGTAGNGHAITIFVLRRFSVHEEHVVMGLVRRDFVERDMPGIEGAIAQEGNFLPAGEGAEDFHAFRRFSPAIR